MVGTNFIKFVGVYQVLTGVLLFVYMFETIVGAVYGVNSSLAIIVLSFFSIFSGVLIYKINIIGYGLSLINQLIQVVTINVGGIVIHYNSIFSFLVYLKEGGKIGFLFLVKPLLNLDINAPEDVPYVVGVNFICVFLILILWSNRESFKRIRSRGQGA